VILDARPDVPRRDGVGIPRPRCATGHRRLLRLRGCARLQEACRGHPPALRARGKPARPALHHARAGLIADHATLIADITGQLSGEMPICVVLDTLNKSLMGSESKDTDMSAYVRAAEAIRDAFKCVVIIVHHCGLDDTRPRGHTALPGA